MRSIHPPFQLAACALSAVINQSDRDADDHYASSYISSYTYVVINPLNTDIRLNCLFVCLWHDSAQWAMASSLTLFLDHTQRRTAVDRNPLDEWSAHRRDLYLTTHTTLTTDRHPGGIRTHNFSRRAAADLRLRMSGHWDRLSTLWVRTNLISYLRENRFCNNLIEQLVNAT